MPIITSLPVNLQNNTVADATQVMSDFNTIVNSVNANAAHNGVNSDITALTSLSSFTSATGTVSGNLAVGGDVLMTGTGQLDLPAGTTAERSASPNIGMIRYNTDLSVFEGYGPSGWALLGGGMPMPCANKLYIVNNATLPNSRFDVTAGSINLPSPVGSVYRSNVSFTVDVLASGAGGLDTGVVAQNTWYYIWAIDNGTSIAGLFSLSSTSPTLPSGYTYACRLGAVKTASASTSFLRFFQRGAHAQYDPTAGSNTTTYPLMASFTSTITLSAFIPPSATSIAAYCVTNGQNSYAALATSSNDDILYANSVKPDSGAPSTPSTHALFIVKGSTLQFTYFPGSSSTFGQSYCVGWIDSVLAS